MNSLVQKYKEMAMRQSNVLLEHILMLILDHYRPIIYIYRSNLLKRIYGCLRSSSNSNEVHSL
jgi:hypothetical protein